MPDEILTPAETSSMYKVPEKTLAQWRYLGRGPRFLKLGQHVRYRASDLEAWLSSCERAATGEALDR